MIEASNGKWSVLLKPESDADREFIKALNKPPIGYVMYSGTFLVGREYLPMIMERYREGKEHPR